MKLKMALLMLFAVGLFACQKNHKHDTRQISENPDTTVVYQPPPVPPNDIAPGHSRVIGKIVEISDSYTIEVEQLLGYGASFSVPIPAGSRITVIITGVGEDSTATDTSAALPPASGDVISLDIRRNAAAMEDLNGKPMVFISNGYQMVQKAR